MALVVEEEVDKEQGSMNEILLQKPEAISRASPSLQPASSQPQKEKPGLEHCHDPHKKTSATLIIHLRWSQQLLLGFRQLSCRLSVEPNVIFKDISHPQKPGANGIIPMILCCCCRFSNLPLQNSVCRRNIRYSLTRGSKL